MGQNVIIVTGKSIGERYWSPSNVATNMWLDSADYSTITESGGKVSEWRDKSGNVNNAVQLTGSKQPIYNSVDAMFGGRPSMFTDETIERKFDLTNVSAKRAYVVLYFADGITTPATNHNAILSSYGQSGAYRVTLTNSQTTWNNANEFNELTYRDGSTVHSMSALPMPSTLWKFESTITRTQDWRILHGNASYTKWNGGVGEIIFTDGSEDLATQQRFEGYLAWKWGIALAVGHPYEFARPVT